MSFALRCLITGSPLANDADPNATPPPQERVFTTPLRYGSQTGGPVQVFGLLADGTSCNFTVWVWQPELGGWFKVGDTTSVAARALGIIAGVPSGAEAFVQLTAIVGAPTSFGVGIGFGQSEAASEEPDAWKQPVRLATVAALPACSLVGNRLTGNANGVIPPATTDGFAVAVGNDVLVKDQGGGASHLQDGPYRVVDVGLAGGGGRPWIMDRTPHCDESGEVFDGMMVVVGEGATLAGHIFQQVTNPPIDLGVTALEFRDQGTLLALVTVTDSGTVSPLGGTIDEKLSSDGITPGGAWHTYLSWRGASLTLALGDLRFDTQGSIYGEDIAAGNPTSLFQWVAGLTIQIGEDAHCTNIDLRCKSKLETPGSIVLKPLGGGADDAAQIEAALATYKTVHLSPGTYSVQTPIDLPNHCHLVAGPLVRIVSTLPVVGTTSNVFYAHAAAGAGTVLHANNVTGTPTLMLDDNTGMGAPTPTAPVGILVGAGNYWSYLNAIAIAGAGHPYTLTVDRPVLKQFALGNQVVPCIAPHDIVLEGKGAHISGTGDRAFEFSGGAHCVVSGWNVDIADGAFSSAIASFDIGSYDCHFERMHLQGAAITAGGLALESAEQCTIRDCIASGVSAGAYGGAIMIDCDACTFDAVSTYGCQHGFLFESGGGVYGSRDCVMINCVSEGNVSNGFVNQNGSSRNKLIGCSSVNNGGYGFYVLGGLGNTEGIALVGCSVLGGTVGVCVTANQTGVKLDGCAIRSTSSYSIDCGGHIQITNHTENSCGQGIQISGTGSIKCAHATLTHTAAGAFAFLLGGSGPIDIDDVTASFAGGGTCGLYSHNVGGVLKDRHCRITGVSGTSYGYYGRNGTKYLRGPGNDFSLCTTPYSVPGGCEVSFGTVTLAGAAAVTHAFTPTLATDRPRARRATFAGTPGHYTVAPSAGVGVVVTGTALDTSTVEVDLI